MFLRISKLSETPLIRVCCYCKVVPEDSYAFGACMECYVEKQIRDYADSARTSVVNAIDAAWERNR